MSFSEDSIKKALSQLRENKVKRNFDESIDLIITLKDLDLKKNDQQVDIFVTLQHKPKKDIKVCAFVDQDDYDSAKEVADFVIAVSDFEKYKNKKLAKELANKYDHFISSAPIMPKVASVFGRVLGPRGKMPNPKVGGVFPPKFALKSLVEKLHKTIRLRSHASPVIQAIVGKESYTDEELIDNIKSIYTSLIHALPNEENNIKKLYIKSTMGKPIKIE